MEFTSQKQLKAVNIIVLKREAHIIEWVLGCANILGTNTNDERHGYISEMYIIISSSLIVPLGVDLARVY